MKSRNLFTKIAAFALMLVFAFAIVGCGGNKKNKVEVSLSSAKNTIVYGEKVKLNVTVTGATNSSVTWEFSDDELVEVSIDYKLSLSKKVTENKKIKIKVTSVEDTSASAEIEITAVAPKIDVNIDKSSIKVNESANITVNSQGLLNKEYDLSVSDNVKNYVTVENNVITLIKDVDYPLSATITATAKDDATVKGSAMISLMPSKTEVVKIQIASSADVVKYGETINFSVKVTGSEDVSYTYTVSNPELVKMEGDTLVVLKEITLDQYVIVTAISNADKKVQASKGITVKAPVVEGQVGELTSAMLEEISNSSITVTGTLTDYYRDMNQSMNNVENTYEMTVKMTDGAWSGEFHVKGRPETSIFDNYRRGKQGGVYNEYGQEGHALERIFINKNNEVTTSPIKNYNSIPTLWETQHLWNHLDNLNINKFEYDAENGVYEYKPDMLNADQGIKTDEEYYFLTYLSFSLTPMLSDTLDRVYLVVEDGHVTKLLAQTETIYYGANGSSYDAMSYTTMEVSFSNIGTTVVEDPAPFENPDHVELLEAALAKMQNAKNYTFRAVDTETRTPSYDEGDYFPESLSTQKGRSNPFVKGVETFKAADYVSSTGTVGRIGQVTEDAVLFATTSKYTFSMDGKNYTTKYSGYKQNSDGTYDHFEYNATQKALVGTKKVTGNLFDVMPKFEFSAAVFEFVGTTSKSGKTYYTFSLREGNIIRDIAMQVSAYNYASDAEATLDTLLEIVVDGDGNLVSTKYPYSIVGGTYTGYVTTTYSDFDTTVLPEDTFDDYVPRQIVTDWSQVMCKYYSPDFSTQTSREENAQVVFESVFGADYADVPTPVLFFNVFGDNMYGPFYDWKTIGTDSDGNEINHGYVSITTQSSNFDENAKITDYEEIMQKLDEELTSEGFVLSVANTDMTGGQYGQSNRYACYVKGNVQIVIENNHTKYFWIYFYITGDWNLRR